MGGRGVCHLGVGVLELTYTGTIECVFGVVDVGRETLLRKYDTDGVPEVYRKVRPSFFDPPPSLLLL